MVGAPNAVSEKLLKAAAAGVTADDRARRARLGVTAPYLLDVGRLNRRKNLARLICAFSASGLADHDLVLAGAKPVFVFLAEELPAAPACSAGCT